MSESQCLRRSFSHPSSSTAPCEFREGDPIRALTESISFGRFVSDSLDWGKWSSFNSNRYLEEADKFSKPGSVAQKKAFFEAHYKKKAVPQAATQIAEVVMPSDSEAQKVSMQLDAIKEVDNETSLEKLRAGASSVEISFPADEFVVVPKDVIDESKRTVALPDLAEEMDVLRPNLVRVPEELLVYEKEAPLTKIIHPQLEGSGDGMILDSREEKEAKSSSSASTPIQTLTSKVAKARTAKNAAGNGRKSASKRPEEKSTGPRSLHMSINLASASGLSQSWKTSGPKFSPIFEKERPSSTSTQNQFKEPASKHSLCSPASNVKRIVSVLNKSMTEPMRMTTDNKSNPLCPSYSRCSTIAETSAKPSAVHAPFGLRSAERAQKRKEFFLKQQERITAKEAEKRQPVQRMNTRLLFCPRMCVSCACPLVITFCSKFDFQFTQEPPIARPSSPESANNLTSTNSGVSKSRRRTAAPYASNVRKHVQENASPNIPV